MSNRAGTEDRAVYAVGTLAAAADRADDAVIERAIAILNKRMRAPGVGMTSPQACRDFLRLLLADRPHEVFVCVFLDAQNRVLATEEMFRGTLSQTSVYPREVIKAALSHNAAAMIFAHNHPSGSVDPSRADELLTQALKQAAALVDVRVLDHFVIAGDKFVSFAERGLL